MKGTVFYILGAIIILAGVAGSEQLQVGNQMPDFRLSYATKDTIAFEGISSDDLKGRAYVLATYPADWSGGCTKEVCTFRDAISQFEDLNIEILGLSADSPFSHRAWAKDQNLNFKLLSDPTGKYGQKIGVYNEESGMFKRSVFVIGPDGKVKYIDYEYSVKDDADFELLKQAVRAK